MPTDPGNAVVLATFLEQLKIKHYSPRSIDSYRHCLVNFLSYIEKKGKILKGISKQDILDYASYLKEKGYSANSIQRYLSSIKRFFKHLDETFYILINPAETLIIRKVPQKIPVVLTQDEVKRLINQPNTSTLVGIRDRTILEVLYSTGIRLNELRNLTIFDIDTSSGFLRVNKGKFAKDRFVPLTKAACFYLKEYISKVRPRFTKNRLQEQALFVGQKGKRINKVIVERLIRDYAKQAGITKRVTTHTFRHTFATHLLDNEVDIFKIQKLLGHSRASITQVYTRVSPKQIKEAHRRHHPREKMKDEGRETKDERNGK